MSGPNKEDILRAMQRFDDEGMPEGFRGSRYYDVIHTETGSRYPIKAIWGLATNNNASSIDYREPLSQLPKLGYKVLDKRKEEPVSKAFDEAATEQGTDGALRQVTSNRYERDPKLRRACVDFFVEKGGLLACQVCKMDFESQYGEIGRGFIHIHHVTPLADGQGERTIDPTRDLIPVCPNCHAMLHMKPGKGAYEVKELREMLENQRTNPPA